MDWRNVVKFFEESKLKKMSLSQDNVSISLEKFDSNVRYEIKEANSKKESVVQDDITDHIVSSPMVGVFYRSPSPDRPPFVDIGVKVKKGDVICIIEAMKLMNEVKADKEGEVVDCFCQDGSPVEFGSPLFSVK